MGETPSTSPFRIVKPDALTPYMNWTTVELREWGLYNVELLVRWGTRKGKLPKRRLEHEPGRPRIIEEADILNWGYPELLAELPRLRALKIKKLLQQGSVLPPEAYQYLERVEPLLATAESAGESVGIKASPDLDAYETAVPVSKPIPIPEKTPFAGKASTPADLAGSLWRGLEQLLANQPDPPDPEWKPIRQYIRWEEEVIRYLGTGLVATLVRLTPGQRNEVMKTWERLWELRPQQTN